MNYLDKLKHLRQRSDTDHTVQPGDFVQWARADASMQTGIVDAIHVDDTGACWGFLIIGESWAVVKLKFATVMKDAAQEDASTVKVDACNACQGKRRWVSIHGNVICGECHPPACASLVKEWIG